MNGLEFRHRGREMVDYLVDYLDNIDARYTIQSLSEGRVSIIFCLTPAPPILKPSILLLAMSLAKLAFHLTFWVICFAEFL